MTARQSLFDCRFGVRFCGMAVSMSLGFVNVGFGLVYSLIGLFGSGRFNVVAGFLGRFRYRFSGFFCGRDRLRMGGYGERGCQYQCQNGRCFHNGIPLVLR
jgi:hypothetical protein